MLPLLINYHDVLGFTQSLVNLSCSNWGLVVNIKLSIINNYYCYNGITRLLNTRGLTSKFYDLIRSTQT